MLLLLLFIIIIIIIIIIVVVVVVWTLVDRLNFSSSWSSSFRPGVGREARGGRGEGATHVAGLPREPLLTVVGAHRAAVRDREDRRRAAVARAIGGGARGELGREEAPRQRATVPS